MKRILFIEDYLPTQKMYLRQLDFFLKGELNTKLEILTATSIDEAREKFKLGPDIIVFDGTIDGPSVFNPNGNSDEVYPNTVVLVYEFRKTFNGPMIAACGSDKSREVLMEAGCDHGCLEKNHVPKKIINILGLV